MERDGFVVETLMNIRTAEAGWRIYEVTSYAHPCLKRTSSLRAIKDGWRIPRIIERGNSAAASVHSCPDIGAAAAISFPQPVPITGAEVKADAEVES